MKKRVKSQREIFQPIINATKDILSKTFLTKSLDFNAGLESELQNPDKVLLDKNKDLTLYDLMLLDDKIKNSLSIFKRLVTSVGGNIIPGSEDEKDKQIADEVNKMLNSMTIRFWDIFDNLLDARAYGFKIGELIWNVDNQKVILKNIKFKHSIFFDFKYTEEAELESVYIGYRYGENKIIPADEFKNKFIYFINPFLKDNSYYGESDLMSVYAPWRSKTQISKFRNIYLQNYGFPIPIATYDYKITTVNEIDSLKDQLKNFQEMMFFTIPGIRGADGKLSGKIDIQFHKAETSGGAESFSEAIDQLDKQIARNLLIPDKLGFSESSGGSYNLGENQFEILKLCVKDYQGRLEDSINKIIKLIVDFNYLDVENYPEWKFESNEAQLSETMLKTLIEQKIIDRRERWIRPYIGIPELSEQEKEDIKVQQGLDPQPQLPFPAQRFKKEEFKKEIPINFKHIEDQYNNYEADFISQYKKIMTINNLEILRQVKSKKIIENKDTSLLKTLRMPKSELKDLYSNYFAKLYISGKVDSINEVDKKVNKITKELMKNEYESFKPDEESLWIDREWVDKYLKKYGSLGQLSKKDKEYLMNYRDKAFFITGETESEVIKSVEKTIMSGLRNGLVQDVIISKIKEDLSEMTDKYAVTIARTNSSEAYNSGRMNMFSDDKISNYIEAYQYSAIMDETTTDFCAEHNDHIIYPSDPEFPTINPPNHYNCRSILIPIMAGDGQNEGDYYYNYDKNFKDWNVGVSKSAMKPSKDFGG